MVAKWDNLQEIEPKSFVCGYCGTKVSSDRGYRGVKQVTRNHRPDSQPIFIYICSGCKQPVYFDEHFVQHPSSIYGENIENIPKEEIKILYNEARHCSSCGAFSAAVMCCRKLLMHIAVDKGAPENKKFIEYIDYLVDNHYIHDESKEWVDLIRLIGNDANHEIKIMTEKDAKLLIDFISMILKILFDYPARAKQHLNKP